MIMSGDFNTATFGSLLHMINNKTYDPEKLEKASHVP